MVQGDWEDVQIELGLKTKREHPRKPNEFTKMGEQLRAALGVKLTEEGQLVPIASKKEVAIDRPMTKVGRNDPCPCGSGKKYKQCHGKL